MPRGRVARWHTFFPGESAKLYSPQPVIPGLRAGTRGVSTSAPVAPPPRVSATDHNRVADLVSEGNGKHVLSARGTRTGTVQLYR